MKDKILQILSEPAVRKRLVDEFEVKFLLLFGSTAVGVRKRSSDLDFAIYFKRVLSKEDETKLVAFLKDRLAADKLDVVCLNDASCALRYEVTRTVFSSLKSETETIWTTPRKHSNNSKR
jgi:predicted nucleotidyltransferase